VNRQAGEPKNKRHRLFDTKRVKSKHETKRQYCPKNYH